MQLHLNNNFRGPARIDGDVLHVMGASDPPEGGKLVSRHIALQQGTNVVTGPANLLAEWSAEPPVPNSGIQAGDALAIATETHFVESPAMSFVSVTWTQMIKVV